MTANHSDSDPPRPADVPAALRLWRGVLDLFSSIWFGVILLAILFVYSSIGSAGLLYFVGSPFTKDNWYHVYPRQWRGIELTEFEWFHWWPFDLLITLICLTLVVVTIRRIPFTAIRLGAWIIHTGLVTLALASVWYFSAKVEGDTLIVRRSVVIELPGAAPQRLPAVPGNRLVMRGSDGQEYTFQVADTDPEWELLTGADQGKITYAVSVMIETPERRFVRQLLAEYPEYTEDVIPGEGRAIRVVGRAILDDSISLRLETEAQPWFHLVQSSALYLREHGTREWSQRPLPTLPKYQDYLGEYEEVFLAGGDPLPPLDPLAIRAAAIDANDPLAGAPITVDRYLRYATMTRRMLGNGPVLNPAIRLHFETSAGAVSDLELFALDARQNRSEDGAIRFTWIDDEAEIRRLSTFIAPRLSIHVPESDARIELDVEETVETAGDELPFQPIEGTTYSFRIRSINNELPIRPGQIVSVATIEIRAGDRLFLRWVFDDPVNNRDFLPGTEGDFSQETLSPDTGIDIAYAPGYQPAPLLIAAGPGEEQLRFIIGASDPRHPRIHVARQGDMVPLLPSVSARVDRYIARASMVERPGIVPSRQRDKNLDLRLRMIRVQLPEGSDPPILWLPFTDYAFQDETYAMGRFPYEPARARLADGREIELLFSRERRLLPSPMVLDAFDWHRQKGGYTGTNLSIRNWTSMVRFLTGTEHPRREVSVNDPAEYEGYWFFQAMWDPPSPPRAATEQPYKGLNYTVLGVGNREGVHLQLFGCCVAVIGMIYAFYIKPIIKRRRQRAVYHAVEQEDAS